MDDKNKVISFEDLKKKQTKDASEIEKKASEDTSKKDSNGLDINDFKTFMDSMGVSIDENMNKQLLEALNSKEVMDMIGKLDINSFDPSSIGKLASEMKTMEAKYKKEQMSFRAFGQWQNFYKPYKFENLFPIEFLKEMAKSLGILINSGESKNEIIRKVSPQLVDYLNKIFRLLDRDMIGLIGQVVYNEGEMEFNKLLKEKEELRIDFLMSKCLIARVKNNNSHNLIVPKDVMENLDKIDFIKIDKYNELNQKLIKATIGYINSYGIVPKKALIENLYYILGESINKLFDKTEFEAHLDELLKFSFTESIVKRGLYPNIVIDGEYIHHAVVGFTQSLIDIQNESIKEYKQYELEELIHRGDSYFYEESLSLTKIIDTILEYNSVKNEDVEDLKNLIFTFSKLEFEPSLIMRMIEINYELPEGPKYEMFIDTMRNFYKNSEKWILKGYTPHETNKTQDDKLSKFDASKIVNIDFNKK
ncbi:MAG: hypothetical protein WBH44_11065 [Proteocatella sp.]